MKAPATQGSSDPDEQRFWRVLLSRISAKSAPLARAIPSELSDEKIQVFELFVAETLQLLAPEFQWRVTQVQGDGGIYFRGELEPRHYESLKLTLHYVVLGQVKRRASWSHLAQAIDT